MSFLPIEDGRVLPLPEMGGMPACAHVVEGRTLRAINAALATGRPLLVRGEPGTGKSQLARAAAVLLERPLVHHTVDAHTDTRDLLYTFDAVGRLAEAQVMGARGEVDEAALAFARFTLPGPLWWAFDWDGATKQAERARGSACAIHSFEGADPKHGVVVLVDELDKADHAVPNGLLDALGHGGFEVRGVARVSREERRPLVLVTTNEARALPDAFLRRCLVLQLTLPEERLELIGHLKARGGAHVDASEAVLQRAAELTADDRATVKERGLAPPGQAEYLDLLRAVVEQHPNDDDKQLALLEQVAEFALRKHPPELDL